MLWHENARAHSDDQRPQIFSGEAKNYANRMNLLECYNSAERLLPAR